MMSGEQESYVESKLENFETELDTLISNIGLEFKDDNLSKKILNLSYEELKLLDSEDCAIYCVKLEQYSLYIQSLHNRADNIKNWIIHNSNALLGQYINNYGTDYTKFEQKRIMFINDNSYATALNKQLLTITAKCIELNAVSNKISQIASCLSNLSKVKSWTNQKNQN